MKMADGRGGPAQWQDTDDGNDGGDGNDGDDGGLAIALTDWLFFSFSVSFLFSFPAATTSPFTLLSLSAAISDTSLSFFPSQRLSPSSFFPFILFSPLSSPHLTFLLSFSQSIILVILQVSFFLVRHFL